MGVVGPGDQPRETRSCGFGDLNSVIGIGSAQHRANSRTVDEERVGRRRRSLHNGPSITANQLRQRAEAVKADPNLFGSPAQRVALTAEHAAAPWWLIDHPIRPNLIML